MVYIVVSNMFADSSNEVKTSLALEVRSTVISDRFDGTII